MYGWLILNIKYYLVGLWEGDGYIWIFKIIKFFSGKKYIFYFVILFVELEYFLVLELKVLIGGLIWYKVENYVYVFIIILILGLINIINLINGCFRILKLIWFNDMIYWINWVIGSFIFIYNVDNSNLFNNVWLVGFIEVDGLFDIWVF